MLHTTRVFLFFIWFQSLNGWELLSSVEIVKGFDDFMGVEVDRPIFSEQLKIHEGKVITLEGFIIPLQQDESQDYFILSRFPYQSCFFCGGAGPETVVEVYSGGEFKYTGEKVSVRGKLKLNHDNPLHLFYIIEGGEVNKIN